MRFSSLFVTPRRQLRLVWKFIFVYLFIQITTMLAYAGLIMLWTPLVEMQAYFSVLCLELVTIGSVWLFTAVFEKKRIAELGLAVKSGLGRQVLLGSMLAFISMTLIFIILVLGKLIKINGYRWDQLGAGAIAAALGLSLLEYILVAFSEEILCRGYIMHHLRERCGNVTAVIGSALIFALLHIFNPNVTLLALVNIFLVGVLFSYTVLLTGSLWMAIGYHLLWNFSQGSIYGLSVSGMTNEGLVQVTQGSSYQWLTGGAFGPEGGLLVTLVIILGILLLKFFDKKLQKQ